MNIKNKSDCDVCPCGRWVKTFKKNWSFFYYSVLVGFGIGFFVGWFFNTWKYKIIAMFASVLTVSFIGFMTNLDVDDYNFNKWVWEKKEK